MTKIGTGAFMGCKGLSKVTLPPSLASIGSSAFRDCDGLTAITVPSRVTAIGNYAFAYCDNLETATINSTAAINTTTFEADYKLKNVKGNNIYSDGVAVYNADKTQLICIIDKTVQSYTNMPETVAEIGLAFKTCEVLTNLKLSAALKAIPNSAFVGCTNLATVSFPSTSALTTIGQSAFEGCEKLNITTLPTSLTQIGDYAFKGCQSLNIKRAPNALLSIGVSAFENCFGLQNLSLPYTTTIKSEAFKNCRNLQSVAIPQLANLTDRMFEGCERLQFAQIPLAKASRNSGEACFGGCAALRSISLPQVTELPDSIFYGCTKLRSISLPQVTELPDSIFYGCTKLQTITLSSDVARIGKSAFENCSGLTSITEFLNPKISVDRHAFMGCNSLKWLRFRNTNVPFAEILQNGEYVIDDIPQGLTIYVPGGSKSLYESSIVVDDVTIIEDIESSDINALKNLIANYSEIDYEPLTVARPIRQKEVLTDVSQLSANYIEEGEGSLADLLDDDDDTYFLSAWSQDNPNGENHYLQIDMQTIARGGRLMFKKRSSNDGLAPTKVIIYVAENPNSEWTKIGTMALQYDNNNVAYTPYLTFGFSTRYVRAEVVETADNNKENNNLYFALNKLGVVATDGYTACDGICGDPDDLQSVFSTDTNIRLEGFYDMIKLTCGNSLWANNSLPCYANYDIPNYISRNTIVTYRKDDSKAETEQADYLALILNGNKKYKFKAEYPYQNGTLGIKAVKDIPVDGRFGFSLDEDKYPHQPVFNYENKRYLKDIHIYDRPCKINLLSNADTAEVYALVNRLSGKEWVKNDDADYAQLKAYCDKISSLAASGLYVDFINGNYTTFYADYPVRLPRLVKAGIVKQQGDELVIDYLYKGNPSRPGDYFNPYKAVIPAKTAVILCGPRGNAYILGEDTTNDSAPEGNLLHGTIDEEMTDVEGCDRYYKLSYDKATNWKLGFYWGNEGGQPFMNKPYKAFLALPASMNAMQMDSFSLAEMERGNSGVTTTITNASTINGNKQQGIYSIDGRKVNVDSVKQLPVGVYIVNGKKVIIK